MTKAWTEADDNRLKELVVQYNKQWSVIAQFFPSKTPSQVASRWDKYLDPNLIKGAFTEEEDNLVRKYVEQFGPRRWQKITEFVPGRSAKQCRERWFNHLDPSVIDKDWDFDEDSIIFKKHQEIGPKWSIISRLLPGRTDNAIKNRWNASISKRISKNDKGEDVLLPDQSKRKRRVARQLPSRPSPVKTQLSPETPIHIEKIRQIQSASNSRTSSPTQADEQSLMQLENDVKISNSTDISPKSVLFPSPLKNSPTLWFSPRFSASPSPNSSFIGFIATPPYNIFDYFDTNDVIDTKVQTSA